MKARIKWVEQVSFLGESESGHAILMDGAPEGGGRNLGPRPMETMLLGTGGCTAYDVVLILKNSGQQISGCEVRMQSERAEKDPKVFTRIHMHFIVRGKQLRAQLVEHAIKRSHEKFCSATAMLQSTAQITHDFEIVEN